MDQSFEERCASQASPHAAAIRPLLPANREAEDCEAANPNRHDPKPSQQSRSLKRRGSEEGLRSGNEPLQKRICAGPRGWASEGPTRPQWSGHSGSFGDFDEPQSSAVPFSGFGQELQAAVEAHRTLVTPIEQASILQNPGITTLFPPVTQPGVSLNVGPSTSSAPASGRQGQEHRLARKKYTRPDQSRLPTDPQEFLTLTRIWPGTEDMPGGSRRPSKLSKACGMSATAVTKRENAGWKKAEKRGLFPEGSWSLSEQRAKRTAYLARDLNRPSAQGTTSGSSAMASADPVAATGSPEATASAAAPERSISRESPPESVTPQPSAEAVVSTNNEELSHDEPEATNDEHPVQQSTPLATSPPGQLSFDTISPILSHMYPSYRWEGHRASISDEDNPFSPPLFRLSPFRTEDPYWTSSPTSRPFIQSPFLDPLGTWSGREEDTFAEVNDWLRES